MAACRHLATAARVKYPAALQRCKFDTPLLAAGSLIVRGRTGGGESEGSLFLYHFCEGVLRSKVFWDILIKKMDIGI